MTEADRNYVCLLKTLLAECSSVEKVRTRNAHVSRLGYNPKFTFSFTPLVGVRRTAWKTALREWEWFMSGSNFIQDAHPSVRPWWQPWANENGEIPFNYGRQLRHFAGDCGTVDQIDLLVKGLREHPHSRRHVITTWNTADMHHSECTLTNCHHTMTQVWVNAQQDERAGSLRMTTYQRSVDVMVGLPANWLQTWGFLLWLGAQTGRRVESLTWIGGDVHLYDAHRELARRVVVAAGTGPQWKATSSWPELKYVPTSPDFKADDFTLDGKYDPLVDERAELVV